MSNRIDGKSIIVTVERIEVIHKRFPKMFSEGYIDFDELQEFLSEEMDESKESYSFT